MNRLPRSTKVKPPRREGARQVMVVLAVGAGLTLGVFGTEAYISAARQAVAAANAPSEEEIYTGSILFMPDEGKVCRQFLFDNNSGQFSDNGYVDCDRATYRGPNDPPKHWSAARVRVISTGFRRR